MRVKDAIELLGYSYLEKMDTSLKEAGYVDPQGSLFGNFEFNLYLDHDYWNQFIYELSELNVSNKYQIISGEKISFLYFIPDFEKVFLAFKVQEMSAEFYEKKNEWPTEEFDKFIFNCFINE